jgi:hypothetical protein
MSQDAMRADFEEPARRGLKPGRAPRVPLKARIPELPPLEHDFDATKLPTPDQRSEACVNMKLAGAPWPEIVKELGYADVQSARSAYIAALANSHPPEDWDTLRQTAMLRAEGSLARSNAMASADYLIVRYEKDGEIVEEYVPNADKLRWHEQASKDLMNWAIISGAKAPSRVEVTASSAELNQMVQVLLAGQEQREIEADIWDAEVVPDGETEDWAD